MKRKGQSHLPYPRELYRLWFEYLRLARKSPRQDVAAALKRSAQFYDPWGDVLSENFHTWWKGKGRLFEQRHTVRLIGAGEQPSDLHALVVEISLNQSTTKLTRAVKALIEQKWTERQKQSKRKNKTVVSSDYSITEGSEPKRYAVREMLTVYRDIYLKNPTLGGSELLEAVHKYYKGRKQKRWAKIPSALIADFADQGRKHTAMRNLRRYIQKAEKVMLNVANGQFPGKY